MIKISQNKIFPSVNGQSSGSFIGLTEVEWRSSVCLPLPSLGELQRAHLHAAAAVGGPGVPRAAGQGLQVPEHAGADVLRGGLLRVLLLHHRAPHGQALQPAAGGDVRAGPPERERLPLPLRAGERANATNNLSKLSPLSSPSQRKYVRKDDLKTAAESASTLPPVSPFFYKSADV